MKQKDTVLDIKACIDCLTMLNEHPEQQLNLTKEERIALMSAAGQFSRPNREQVRERNKQIKKFQRQRIVTQEKKARAATGIRRAREDVEFSAPLQITDQSTQEELRLHSPRNCYVCKAEYTQMHFFYDSMCKPCAELNYQKRFQTASLQGQVAVITGSRLKIGYHATLMMLRAGATVVATTRFPIDSALRFSKEKDFAEWSQKLHIHGLDLRHTPSVELFTQYIENNYERLDILVNNAAQTVRRPPQFYEHLMQNESKRLSDLPLDAQQLLKNNEDCLKHIGAHTADTENIDPALPVAWNGKSPGIGLYHSAQLSQVPYTHETTPASPDIFPQGKLDADLQQVDLRETNSWRLRLGEIQTAEMIELQLINSIAPFVLCNRLVPLMKRDNTGQKHIVNVSAMEGKFHRFKKSERHPHTNMAKAALNMLTHTSAGDLAKSGIFMNAVDTGWVTDEDPITLSKLKEERHDFQPPLDIVDGAARVCDPFFSGILLGKHWCGKFLKDYAPIDW